MCALPSAERTRGRSRTHTSWQPQGHPKPLATGRHFFGRRGAHGRTLNKALSIGKPPNTRWGRKGRTTWPRSADAPSSQSGGSEGFGHDLHEWTWHERVCSTSAFFGFLNNCLAAGGWEPGSGGVMTEFDPCGGCPRRRPPGGPWCKVGSVSGGKSRCLGTSAARLTPHRWP